MKNRTEILLNRRKVKMVEIMLNITVINCDDKYVSYEWENAKEFVVDMNSDKENIPMLDDMLTEIETDDDEINSYWMKDCCTVNDLYEYCKK